MAPPAEARQWFKLESVNLGNGPCGDGDKVGVATAWEHPDVALDLTEDQEEAALAAIRAGGPWRADAQADDWIGNPIAKAVGLVPTNKLHRKQVTTLVKNWTKQERLEIFTSNDNKHRKAKAYIRATDDFL
jgi:hypothetical protein